MVPARRIHARPRALRPLLACAAFACAAALGACGDSHSRVTTGTYAGESGQNAPYLNVGSLVYQVQLSRELNPADTEDASYLTGLPPELQRLRPGEEWFAVFIQVYNQTSKPHQPAREVTISDTQNNVYIPVVPSFTNEFAYQRFAYPGPLAPKARIPELNTVAANGPTQGALLLYKIKVVSLDNRPLELNVIDPLDPTKSASAELDV
jgi:hypothetical protein